MKTYIINLDVHDDSISARDKMGWAKAGRILLVWPEKGPHSATPQLNRRLDLLMLQRRSTALGSQLALVTHQAEIWEYAPELGIPVFKDLRQAQRSNWRAPRRYRKNAAELKPGELAGAQAVAPVGPADLPVKRALPPRPPASAELHPTIRLVFFFLGILAVLALGGVLIPRAIVSLAPAKSEQAIDIEVSAGLDTAQVSLSGAVPAHPVTIAVEGRDSQPTSGSITLPDQAATGQVVFTNLTDSAVEIPENTIIRSTGESALGFAVTQAGQLPAGPGQNITLPVRCLTLGSRGNLPAGKLVAIEGLLGTQATVSNPQPTRGGSDRKEPAPSDADRRKLYERLLQSLQDSALEGLQSDLLENDLLIASSLHLVEIVEESYLPAENQPADQLQLTLRAEYQALKVTGADLRTLADVVLNANLPPGFTAVSGSLQIENVSEPQLEADQASWNLSARRQLMAQIPAARAARLVLGLSPEQAGRRLAENLPLAAPPQIELFPAWWPRLSILPLRIQVIIQP